MSFNVVFFFEEYSLLCYHFHDSFQELKAWIGFGFGVCFFFKHENCPLVAWTCCLPFISDGLFSFLLAPTPHTSCELCVFQGLCYLYSIAADPGKNLGREQCSAQLLPGITCEQSSLRSCGMRPPAGSAQNAELSSPVAVRNATETCDTAVLCDTGAGPKVTAPWMISKKAASSACISFSQG